MTHLPTGDRTFWTRDKVLCLNSLRKWRSVDVVAGVSWARQDMVETGRGQAGAGRGQCQRLVSGQHPVSRPLCPQLGATGEGVAKLNPQFSVTGSQETTPTAVRDQPTVIIMGTTSQQGLSSRPREEAVSTLTGR